MNGNVVTPSELGVTTDPVTSGASRWAVSRGAPGCMPHTVHLSVVLHPASPQGFAARRSEWFWSPIVLRPFRHHRAVTLQRGRSSTRGKALPRISVSGRWAGVSSATFNMPTMLTPRGRVATTKQARGAGCPGGCAGGSVRGAGIGRGRAGTPGRSVRGDAD